MRCCVVVVRFVYNSRVVVGVLTSSGVVSRQLLQSARTIIYRLTMEKHVFLVGNNNILHNVLRVEFAAQQLQCRVQQQQGGDSSRGRALHLFCIVCVFDYKLSRYIIVPMKGAVRTTT